MSKMERRYLPADGLEIRSEEDGKLIVEGYPIVFNERTVLYPGFAEIIMPGAASDALSEGRTVLYWNHNTDQPMAAMKNGTLEAHEDENGVFMRAEVSGSEWGRMGHEAIKSGLVDQMSFGFFVERDGQEWSTETDKETGAVVDVRSITKFSAIPDFSPVSQPAYPTTEIQARSKDLALQDKPESSTEEEDAPSGDEAARSMEMLRLRHQHKGRNVR